VRIDAVAWDHPASVSLRAAQRAEIEQRYGTPFVAFGDDGEPLGCGGLRQLDPSEAEVKRMFVAPSSRGTGVSTAILARLEHEGRDRGYARLVLETGDQQPDAIRFYSREGYTRIPSFGYYADSDASLCFEKKL